MLASAASAETAADFYKGRTVTYIVATGPGGGADFFGHMATRHMQRLPAGSNLHCEERAWPRLVKETINVSPEMMALLKEASGE